MTPVELAAKDGVILKPSTEKPMQTIVCDPKVLAGLVAQVKEYALNKTKIKILHTVVVSQLGTTLTVTATDLKTYAQVFGESVTPASGMWCIEAKSLIDALDGMTGDSVSMCEHDGIVEINDGRHSAKLGFLPYLSPGRLDHTASDVVH
jgi:DNA polymerase III sliding clamp (beta) subunit (PCNA family)